MATEAYAYQLYIDKNILNEITQKWYQSTQLRQQPYE